MFIHLCVLLWAFTLWPPVKPALGGRQGRWSHEEDGLLGSQGLVTELPGQPAVAFRQYAGYVTVHEENGRALFYWFFEASPSADDKPLVLWLNGGPGCSSVGYGATQEIGPFLVDSDGPELKSNPYSWNKGLVYNPHPEANLLFLESPAGVGFSYSNTTSDYDHLGDDFTANDTYTFLHKWFERFPLYRKRDFYIAGESYAGKYVPELAALIRDRNEDAALRINLRGFLTVRTRRNGGGSKSIKIRANTEFLVIKEIFGQPETDDGHDWQGMVDYAWSHAVVSDKTHDIIAQNCDFLSNDTWSNKNCTQAVNEVLHQYRQIDIYSLYTPVCIKNSTGSPPTTLVFSKSSNMMPRVMAGYDPCLDDYARSFYNRIEVQKALHANGGISPKNWTICNKDIFERWVDSKPSVLPIYKKLIADGLRIWVYSGDTDGRVPVLSTRYSLNALGLPTVGSWKPWYHQRQVAGWLQEYEGLTFATFRGAGHAVPTFKPSASLALFASFLAGKSPPLTL